MKIKNVFLYKNKKKIILKKNIFDPSFKKKIVKILYINNKNFFFILKILKVILLFNFYSVEKDISYIFLKNYNFLKNIWKLFIIAYYYINDKIKKKIKYFFNFIIKKSIMNNIFFFNKYLKKVNIYFFFKFKFNVILKLVNLNLLLQFLNWRKNNLKINLFIEPLKINKKINFFILKPFFNNYKKKKFVSLIKYLINFFNFEIEKAYILFWKRLYIYNIKRLFLKIEYIKKKYFKFLLKQYKLFYSIINFSYKKKRKNKVFFFFSLLQKFVGKEYLNFFNFYRLFKYYKYVKDSLLTCNYIKKKNFFLFFFKYNNKKNKLLYKFYNKLKLLKIIIKIKILIILKNLIFLFFLQFLIGWLNCYIFFFKNIEFNQLIKNNQYKDNNLNVKVIKTGLTILRNSKWNRLLLFRLNYFFYNNIIVEKSGEIGKRKKNLIK